MERRPIREWLASLVLLALTWWMSLPEHQQTEIKMSLARTIQRRSHRLAAAMGRDGMAAELAGDDLSAAGAYDAAHRVMGVHDRAQRWYQRLGGVR